MLVRVRMLVCLSPCLLCLLRTPASATSVRFPCPFLPVLAVWYAACSGCVCLKAPRLGPRAGRSQRGQGRGAGRAKSFGVLTKAKGEQRWPATGKFGND